MSHTLRVVSRDPEMAVLASDIFRHLTVEVWPRSVCKHALDKVSLSLRDGAVLGLPSSQIPHSDIAITPSANQDIIPRHHGPHAHDVSLQRLLSIAFGVEDMNLGVVES